MSKFPLYFSLTTQTLSVMFSLLSFVIFGIVLFFYNWPIFLFQAHGSFKLPFYFSAADDTDNTDFFLD